MNRIDEIKNRIKEIELELESTKPLADKANVYQMGLKILNNSMYGALSGHGTTFAGHSEYFGSAITSCARVANLIVGQNQSKLINRLVGLESREIRYGLLTHLDNVAQQDTDSNIIGIEPILIKKFGKDYKSLGAEFISEFILKFVNKVALPEIRNVLDNEYGFTQNAYLLDKLQEDTEIIADSFISLLPKMYFCRKIYDEGLFYKPEDYKLKITGLSPIRNTTPKYFKTELKKAMNILIDADIQKVAEYIKNVKMETSKRSPNEICINQSVSSLDYTYDPIIDKYRKWNGKKFLSAPVNSYASLSHNKYVADNKLNIKQLEAGDKISFVYMKGPNMANTKAFAFKDESVFNHGLKDYIDYNTMFEKGFLSGIKLITDPLGWDLTPQEDLINMDDW